MSDSAPAEFPWGDLDPAGGFRVGDVVGILYSDHEDYFFDEPTGVVTAVDDEETDADDECGGIAYLTVQVESGSIPADRVYLIERKESE